MAYKLQLKRGASGSLPTGSAGEPLFTTDTNDLYIGTGGANQRFQKYIASGTSAQFLKGDGSLDSTTYTPTSRTLTINGTSLDLSANRTFNVGTVTTAAATTGGQVAFFNGATVVTSVSGLYFDGVDKLGIGTASPTYNLDVTGTSRMTSSSNLQTLYLQNSGTGYGLYNQADSYFQGDVKFQSVSNTILKVDASHKLIAAVAGTDYQAPITNPVTGTGTTNYLPKWTSGSALGNSLVYDSGTNVGIGTASPSTKLQIEAGAGNSWIRLTNTTNTSGMYLGISSGGEAIVYQAGDYYMGFYTNSTERARFTAGGNLLVNSTTDNGNRLQVTGNGYFSGNVGVGTATGGAGLTAYSNGILRQDISGTTVTQYLYSSASIGSITTDGNNISYNAASSLIFGTNGTTERMRLDSSGNLGLGVVPSSWDAAFKVFQIGKTALFEESSVATKLTTNLYYASGNKYIGTGEASAYEQYIGQHIWKTAPSGTAGNPITFTQAMTLTSGGNLLVGTTVDSGERLVVNGDILSKVATGVTAKIGLTSGSGNSYISLVDANLNMVFVNTSTYNGGDNISDIRFCTNNNTSTPALKLGITGAATFSSSVTATNINLTDGGGGAINNQTGNLFIQTASGNGWIFRNGSPGYAEYMRLTSGGNLLVGTSTDSGERLVVAGMGKFTGNVVINGTIIGTDQTFGGAYRTFAFGDNANGYNRIFATNDATDGIYINAATGQGLNVRVNGGGANVFSIASTGAATFNSSVTTLGICVNGYGALSNSASKFNLDFYNGNTRLYSLGANTTTKGGYEFHTNSSDGSLDVIAFRIKADGIINIANVPSSATGLSAGDIYKDASGFLKIV